MKAITILQPWATLKAIDEKMFETRTWKTDYTGDLLIHAGKSKEYLFLCDVEPFKSTLAKHGYTKENLPLGKIIAKTNLKRCLKVIGTKINADFKIGCAIIEGGKIVKGNELNFGDFTKGRYAWEISNTKMLKEPIPVKGQQRLWNFSEGEGNFINERCPKCGSNLLKNNIEDKWCSNIECNYGLEDK